MIVLDASVMIAVLDRDDAHFEAARALLLQHSGERVVAHRLTIAETLVRAAGSGRVAEIAGALDAMGVGRLDEPDDPVGLAALRARTRLRMPDCVVLHAALRDRARMATFDQALAAAALAEGIDVIGG